MKRVVTRGARVAVALLVAHAFTASTWAQGTGSASRWELEVYGGGLFSTGSTVDGAATLPPRGQPIATSSPVFPSRRVPSWFFGDGADLLNLVNQQFGVAARLQPLDDALGSAAVVTGNGIAVGARARLRLTPRFAVEAAFDLFPASADLSDELVTAAEVAGDSFVGAFEGLLATGPFTDVSVAAATAVAGSSLEIAVTGALVYDLAAAGDFVPYLTFGGGVITGAGGPELTLEGNYAFRIVGEVPIDETDRVTVRVATRTALAALFGGGLRRGLGPRWGVRLDGRVLLAPATTRVLIDTDPQIATGSPGDFVESFTTPAIQFSNDPGTGRESSLGEPGLEGFEAFGADGLRARVLVSVGVFFRF